MSDEFLPYGRQLIDEDDIAAVIEVLRGDWLTTGPAVNDFEHAISERTGGHPAVAVNSGTAALHAAYVAAGVGPGTEIVTTPLTFAATATVALHLGADVIFADVDEGTLLLDPENAEVAVTDRTRAIVPVDYAGQPCDMDAFRALADDNNLVLIEDASHSIGGEYKGRPVGDLADMTTFSFHPVKTVTTGEGGAVVSLVRRYEEPLRRFRNHGLVRDPKRQREPQGDWHQEIHKIGLNYRLPDVLAALGSSQLSKLERFVSRRAELTAGYRAQLEDIDGVTTILTRDDCRPAWHLLPIRIAENRRRHVFDHMRAAGIGVQVHYLPVHLHPVFADIGYKRGDFPIAEKAYGELLSLPLHPALSDSQQERVVEELKKALANG